MTVQEAIKILYPESSFEALFGLDKEAGIKLVEEACLMAVEALEKQIPKNPKKLMLKQGIMTTLFECPVCSCRRLGHGFDLDKCYCPECGQKLDWSKEE